MKDKFNDSFSVPASSLVSIPVTETVAKLLQAMFSTKIGSLELEIDEDGIDSPQLIVSCYLSNVETNKWNDLTQMYMLDMGIKPNQKLFNIGIRAVQKHLKIASDYLGLEGIGTHSLRKFFCTQVYINNQYNIELCRVLMQHSSSLVTQRYIGLQPQLVEQALQNHVKLPN